MSENAIPISEIDLYSQAVIPRQLFTDKRLSRTSAMVFMEMVAWQQQFHCSVNCKADVLKAVPDLSGYLYRKTMAELELFGYVRRKRVHGDDGRFDTVEFSLLIPDVPEDKSKKRSYWQSRRDNGLPDYSNPRNPRSEPLVESQHMGGSETPPKTENPRSEPLVENQHAVAQIQPQEPTPGKAPETGVAATPENPRNPRSAPLVESQHAAPPEAVAAPMPPVGDFDSVPPGQAGISPAPAPAGAYTRARARNELTPYLFINSPSYSEGLPLDTSDTSGCLESFTTTTDNVSERKMENNQDEFVRSKRPKSGGGYETVKELRAKTSDYKLRNCSEEQAMEIFETAYAHSMQKGFRKDQVMFSLPFIDILMEGDSDWQEAMMEAVRQRGVFGVMAKLPSYWLQDGLDELMFSAERILEGIRLERIYGKPIFT